MRVGKRQADVYETAPGIYEVREQGTGLVLARLVDQYDGWFVGARDGGPRRELYQPDGDTERAIVRLLTGP